MAGAVGIEPTLAVLETAVLPLYDAPVLDYLKPSLFKRAVYADPNCFNFFSLSKAFESSV